jgi:hypothetical protein
VAAATSSIAGDNVRLGAATRSLPDGKRPSLPHGTIAVMPANAAPHPVTPTRCARPDATHLQLTLDLGSRPKSDSAAFGWHVWHRAIDASWDTDDIRSPDDLTQSDESGDGNPLPFPAGATAWGGATGRLVTAKYDWISAASSGGC